MQTLRGLVFVTLILLLSMAVPASSNSSGAPDTTCSTLTPQHGTNRMQTSPSPYTITFSPDTYTPGGSPITVTLTTTSGKTFMGFLLTTQYEGTGAGPNPTLGTFGSLPAKTKLICPENSAVTHTDRNTQNSLSFQWIPPATGGGNVRFKATFVQQYGIFWVNVTAKLLTDSTVIVAPTTMSQTPSGSFAVTGADPNVTGADTSVTGQSVSTVAPQTAPSSTLAPGTSGVSTSSPTTVAASGSVRRDAECGSTKGCFSDCDGEVCTFLLTWTQGQAVDDVFITMSGVVSDATGRYIALGLSQDDKMGSDSVVFCINTANGVFLSYNVDGDKFNKLDDNPKEGLGDIQTSYEDGVLSCSFTRPKAEGNGGTRFALDKSYTLFYATGPGDESGTSYHEETPLISTQTASLVDFSVDIGGSASELFVKVHGSLMIVAWIFAASIGIIFARYFKDVWEDNSCFGQKIWFQIHRTCMVIALLATVIAFIIIFVDVEGYSDIQGEAYKKAHPILGIIVTALTVINPIMAVFRPHPGTPKRPIFNWAHWYGWVRSTHTRRFSDLPILKQAESCQKQFEFPKGVSQCTEGSINATLHLPVITIFFGVLLNKARAPKYILYILAAYVGWQVLIQILMEIAQCMGRNSGHTEMYEMTTMDGGGNSKATSRKEVGFSKCLLGFLHMLVITGFAAALIVILNIGKDG